MRTVHYTCCMAIADFTGIHVSSTPIFTATLVFTVGDTSDETWIHACPFTLLPPVTLPPSYALFCIAILLQRTQI